MMNIQKAKEEIKDAISAYLKKDAYGEYVIPRLFQRPILLIGAPGIGKTQIMAQIAMECKIALVSYTITHHTRQSAIGLPFITKRLYDGKEVSVTEYTMSEIVAAIYNKMERTGLREGILFIDEINCVSETLAPAMLQFLQYKTFGSHEIPEGWIIVAAGNPPEYNKSVRDFDVVTLDRIRKIDVEPDLTAWKTYAYQMDVAPVIISYLTNKPQNFYRMESTVDGPSFATPRGWEDLSRILKVYKSMNKTVGEDVIIQYLQHPTIAKDFSNYLELYEKYEEGYQLDEIFQGNIPDVLLKKIAHAGFDERLSVISLLLSRILNRLNDYQSREEFLKLLHPRLRGLLRDITEGSISPLTCLDALSTSLARERDIKQSKELLSPSDKASYRKADEFLGKLHLHLATDDVEEAAARIRNAFAKEKRDYDTAFEETGIALERAFDFLEAAFTAGQELVIFITELNTNRRLLSFLSEYDCERYYQYNKSLLYEDRSRVLLQRIEQLT